MSKLLEHVARNRAYWDDLARQVFSEQLSGKDAIELGCGTAYISAWLSRRGARVVGIDNSEAQLGTARRLQQAVRARFSAHPRRRTPK
jgi:2-polyprenyl-3-methyl-5-hydroxy-6-metoxy-1,4-benzoquinol methylase